MMTDRPRVDRLAALRDDEGFTLAELAVGIVLMGLLASLVVGSYLFTRRQALQWQQRVRAENALHLVLRRVSHDLFAADMVEPVGSGQWHIVQSDGRQVRYHIVEGQIWRSGKALLPDGVGVHGFTLSVIDAEYSKRETYDSEAATPWSRHLTAGSGDAPATPERALSGWLGSDRVGDALVSVHPSGQLIEVHLTVGRSGDVPAHASRAVTGTTRVAVHAQGWRAP